MKLSIFCLGALALFPNVQSLALLKPTQDCSSTFILSLARSFSGQPTIILNATLIPANSRGGNEYDYCQVIGKVAYPSNNTLNFQVYLPEATAYTGRFMAVGKIYLACTKVRIQLTFILGNGGMAGTIDTSNMLSQLNKGFAVAG